MLIKPNPSARGHARSFLLGLHEAVGHGDVWLSRNVPLCSSWGGTPPPPPGPPAPTFSLDLGAPLKGIPWWGI